MPPTKGEGPRLVVAELPPPEKRLKDAKQLREIALLVETGAIQDFAFIGDNVRERNYVSLVSFEDRWRLLAAIEHAKSKVHACD